MIDNSYKWFPIYTLSRAEKKVHQALEKKNIQSYLPLVKVEKQWSDRRKVVYEPLLKSYLFVYISLNEYNDVINTPGFSRFIYFSGKIAVIPEKQLNDLKLLLISEIELEITTSPVEPGDKVIIKAGPLKGILAELVSLKKNKKIVLKLQSLGFSIYINTSLSFIERLS